MIEKKRSQMLAGCAYGAVCTFRMVPGLHLQEQTREIGKWALIGFAVALVVNMFIL
ncbi:MAG: hypothetical protein HFF00_09505 [Ruminiclostridium sp.]|jgi:hypothetical protein|nr:hypothetical protein [Ruminiclostridium sp.]